MDQVERGSNYGVDLDLQGIANPVSHEDASDRLARLEAENRALREALAPFARWAAATLRMGYKHLPDAQLEMSAAGQRVTVGDLRAAAAVLEREPEE